MNCPSCGGALDWDQRFAHLVVCPYCSSSIVVDEQALRVAGKMNVLAVPDGVLALGASGTIHGRQFRVLGRVRYGYARGVWDEWYVLFDQDEPAWISQDEDGYTLEELRTDVAAPDELRAARPGDLVHVGNKAFHVDERDRAVCEGGEGQLPFDLEPGHEIEYLDLSAADRFATVEIEDEGVRVFLGRTLPVKAIAVDLGGSVGAAPVSEAPAGAGFRDRIVRNTRRSVDLKCLSCAHPLPEVTSGDDTVACKACGTIADLSAPRIDCGNCGEPIPVYGEDAAAVMCVFCNAQQSLEEGVPKVVEILKERKRKGPKWTLPLGRKGTLRGVARQIVGHIRFVEKDEGMRYWSDEYLMYTPGRGYSWLVCENGHFALNEEVRGITKSPRSLRQKQRFQAVGLSWRVFEKGTCEIAWVDGELPWVAHVGDKNNYVDCIAPPYMLSAEFTETEAEWFRAEYVPREEIAEAFGLPLQSLPRATGVAPHQPYSRSPFRSAALRVMPLFALLFLLLAFAHGCGSGTVVSTSDIPSPGTMEGRGTEWFEVTRSDAVCSVDFHADVDNSWVWVGGAVVDESENVVLEFSAEISYYHGSSGGESWSEGSTSDEVVFRLTDPGKYRLLLDGEAGAGSTGSGLPGPDLRVTVRQGVVLLRYYVILFVLTLLWTCGELLHAAAFESRRWSAVLED